MPFPASKREPRLLREIGVLIAEYLLIQRFKFLANLPSLLHFLDLLNPHPHHHQQEQQN